MGSKAFEIVPGLFIGDLSALDALDTLGITHVVTVVNQPEALNHVGLGTRQRFTVDVEDEEEADLLRRLPGATAFIKAALQPPSSGRVLVHCAQGVSRSAAVAVAYLMTQYHLSVAAALSKLRSASPAASPNAGFVRQLELFHAMGCSLQESHVPYKRYLLQQAGREYEQSGTIDTSALAQPEEPGNASSSSGGPGSSSIDGRLPLAYRCRKCRCLVATAHNVVETEEGPGASAFAWRKRDKLQRAGGGTAGSSSSEEGSLFVEPLRWMQAIVGGPVQGKLYCPKCDARLGSFNWSGTQSSSGAWVTPAFQLHLSKLDVVDPSPPAALTAIRQPRLQGSAASPASSSGGASGDAVAAVLPGGDQAAAAAAADVAGRLAASSLADGPAAGVSPAVPTIAEQQSHHHQQQQQPYFTHLILDCDGVMVDSERASCEALRQAILQVTGFDIPHCFPDDFTPVFGMDVRTCIAYYKQRFEQQGWGDTDAVAAQVSEAKEPIYQRLTAQGIPAFSGVKELVAAARAAGLGVAVASSGSPEKIRHNLESSGLAGLVEEHLIVSAKYVARGKPAPDVYLEALRRLGCTDASRALVVEDAVNGLRAAHEAGCFTAGVTNSLPAGMLAPHADLVVGRLTELLPGLDTAGREAVIQAVMVGMRSAAWP